MPDLIYHPKSNHPWRQYKNKKKDSTESEVQQSSLPNISLKNFLENVTDNWETYKIPPAKLEDRDYLYLYKLPVEKQAEWLIGFVKKHWLKTHKGALIFE